MENPPNLTEWLADRNQYRAIIDRLDALHRGLPMDAREADLTDVLGGLRAVISEVQRLAELRA